MRFRRQHAAHHRARVRGPIAAYARDCAWEQDGAARYNGDIRRITGYWSVTFRD